MVSKKKRCIICNKNILCVLYKKRSAKCNKCIYQLRKEYLKNYSKSIKGIENRKKYNEMIKQKKQLEKIKKYEEKLKHEINIINIQRYLFVNKPFLKVICIYGNF